MSNQLIQLIDRTKTVDTNGATPNGSIANDVTANGSTARSTAPLDLAAVRAKLAQSNGQGYWRSLEELAERDDFNTFLQREFPRQAPRDMAPLARRDFLKLMGAALALAGVSGCAFQPAEKIVPYIKQPEELVPGIPQFFATATTLGGYALGLLAESNMGRPTKIEGNPDHPSSLGATDAIAQASVLNLYDPDRSQVVRKLGAGATWDDFLGMMSETLGAQAAKRGAGLRILSETVVSPTLARQMREIKTRFPRMQWHQYEPVSLDNAREGARLAFGRDAHLQYRFDRADTIVSLDCDFLLEEPNHVRSARDFSQGRRVRESKRTMNRLYVAESTPSITGGMADHRLPLRASQIENVARALASQLSVAGVSAPTESEQKSAPWIAAAVKDLQGNRGKSLVVAGANQPAAVHALAHAVNAALGNIGQTVIATEPVEAMPAQQTQSLQNLVRDMKAGRVEMLLVLGGNPAYASPADLNFEAAYKKVPLRVHVGHYDDETAIWSHWHIPETHYLESWSDARGYDGTASIVQPLIAPLYPNTRSIHEVLSIFLDELNTSSFDIVQATWQAQRPGAGFDKQWQKWVHDGFIPNGLIPEAAAAPAPLGVRADLGSALAATQSTLSPASAANGTMEIMFRPDPTIWDGRFANNAWLQELPKPLTKLTWDNAALISFGTAEKMGLTNGDVVNLKYKTRTLRAAVMILPGHPDEAVTLHLGYGRTRAGKIGNGTGFNAYALRTSDAPWFGGGLEIERTSEKYDLAVTAHHNLIDNETRRVDGTHGRELIQVGSIQDFSKDPDSVVGEELKKGLPILGEIQEGKRNFGGKHGGEHHGGAAPEHVAPHSVEDSKGAHGGDKAKPGHDKEDFPSLYPDGRDVVLPDAEVPYAWGMLIDTNVCIGCNACVMSCQAENNCAITGKHEVMNMREMHWLRIDTYYKGEVDNPQIYFQPVTCMHCEKAPCEPVCPVEATQHSPDGMNNMTYNRCIGTRYCSNNCPYKVRRFNFLQYSDQDTPQIQLMANPEVTVRARGVMEKCTYCVQRVNVAKIQAEKEDRTVRDGEIVTACQQVCPTDAITFGNIKDTKSKVSQLKSEPHHFGMLTELNTYPRTTYLAKLYNPSEGMPEREKEIETSGSEISKSD